MNYGFVDVLALLGSLGLFLYGMKQMSDALVLLAGDKMRNILAASTSNRFFALSTGFVITAVIQSSSATTLMVVSFANASLLSLFEATGIIMGANVGTTITGWLISILGFKVKMSAVALPLVALGFVLSLSVKDQIKYWGNFIVGFALLFIGLQFLKDSVPDISNSPDALSFLSQYAVHGYLSILIFLFIGTVLTLVVQSSSASMALALLMCYEGWVPFDMAAAMVVGGNIGTTITAILAAFIGNYQAKRAALAHLVFNLIGVIWIVLLFYPFINLVVTITEYFEGLSPLTSAIAIPVGLSIFHTGFNLINAALLIGFINIIVVIVKRAIPAELPKSVEIDQPQYLDEASIKYVETGVKALTDESVRLLENAAYKVFTHGLGVHRSEIESGESMTKILNSPPEKIEVDIDKVYTTQIKTIYSRILDYATCLQRENEPTQEQIETIRNILVADRLLVQVVKRMKPLQKNMSRYIVSENETMRKEYNVLRRRILKVVREIKRIGRSKNIEEQLSKIEHQRSKVEHMDVLLTGHVEDLLVNQEIPDNMATSLINDSSNASRITNHLIDIAMILYRPTDIHIEEMDERNAEQYAS